MNADTDENSIDALEAAINDKEATARQNQSEIVRYVQTVNETLSELVKKVAEGSISTAELFAETRHEISDYRDRLSGDAGELDALRDQIRELEDANAHDESKIESYRQKLEQSKKQLRDQAGASEDNEAHRARAVELETKLHEMMESNEAAKRRIARSDSELEGKMNAASATIELLEEERDKAKADSGKNAIAMNASRASLELMTPDYTQAKEELDELRASAVGHKSEIRTLMEAVAENAYERKQLEERSSADIEEARRTITELSESSNKARDRAHELSTQLTALEKDLSDAGARNAELEDRLSVQDDSRRINEISELQNRIELLESTAESNGTTISGLKGELTISNEKSDRAEERLEELRGWAKKTADSEQEKDLALEKAQSELSTLRHDRDGHKKLFEQYSELETHVEALRSKNEAMEEELSEERAKGTKSMIASQLAEALKDYDDSQRANGALTKEIEDVKKQLASRPVGLESRGSVDVAFDAIAAKQRLGELLLESGVITQEQLDEVVRAREERLDGGKIGRVFVDKGFASEDVVVQALAHQMGTPYLRIERNTVKHDALRLISERMAEKHQCIPVRIKDGSLIVAMENPMDLIAIEDIERMSEFPVEPVISTSSDIREAIHRLYQGKAAGPGF